MLILVTVLILATALIVGLIANRFVRPFAKTEVQGVKLELLVSPLLTLTVLLLSFVLVQAFGSYNRVRVAEGREASRLAFEYEVAGYYDDEVALPIQEALVCYGRAVVNVEWPTLADGTALHPLPTAWAGQVDAAFAQINASGETGQPYGVLITADRDRAEGRRLRLTEVEPSVPPAVTILMIIVTAAALGTIATFTLPYISRRVQIGALVVMLIVFSGMHWTIYEIDHKFGGVVQVEPTDLRLLTGAMSDEFARRHPDVAFPCDERGEPT